MNKKKKFTTEIVLGQEWEDGYMERFMPTAESLRGSTDEQLEQAYDEAVAWANGQNNVNDSVHSQVLKATFIREELHRRAIELSGGRIERLTWVITGLTLVNAVLVGVTLLT